MGKCILNKIILFVIEVSLLTDYLVSFFNDILVPSKTKGKACFENTVTKNKQDGYVLEIILGYFRISLTEETKDIQIKCKTHTKQAQGQNPLPRFDILFLQSQI